MHASAKTAAVDYMDLESAELVSHLDLIGSFHDYRSRGSFVVDCFYRDGFKYGEVSVTDDVFETEFKDVDKEFLDDRFLKMCGLLHMHALKTRAQYISDNCMDIALLDNYSREYFVSLPTDSKGCRSYMDRQHEVRVCPEDISLRSLSGAFPSIKLLSYGIAIADVAGVAWQLGSSIHTPTIDLDKEGNLAVPAVPGAETVDTFSRSISLRIEFTCESPVFGKWAEFQIRINKGLNDGQAFTDWERHKAQTRGDNLCSQLLEYIENEPALKNLVASEYVEVY